MDHTTGVAVLREFPPELRRRLEPGFAAYEFRFCSPGDWPSLRDFLKRNWSAAHPYVVNPDFERWMLYDPIADRHNFGLAVHRSSGEIHGIQAFLSPSHFDPAIPVCDLWPGLWSAAPGAAAGLGSEITRFLVRELRARSAGSLGLSRNTQTVLTRMGYTMGTMDRHFMLNPDLREFRLVGGAEGRPRQPAEAGAPAGEVNEIGPDEVADFAAASIDFDACVPLKSPAYLRNRYARHPCYRYRFFALRAPDAGAGLIVTREVGAEGARAVRVVSFLGDDRSWAGAGPGLLRIVRESEAEFLDVYSLGIGTAHLVRAGLAPHHASDPLVLPHYFEPLDRHSKDLAYGFVTPPGSSYHFFKGDSDQDRPNLFPTQGPHDG